MSTLGNLLTEYIKLIEFNNTKKVTHGHGFGADMTFDNVMIYQYLSNIQLNVCFISLRKDIESRK